MAIEDAQVEKAVFYIRDKADLIGQLRGQKSLLEHKIKIERSQRFLDADGTVGEREAWAWTDTGVYRLVNELRDCITELDTVATKFKASELLVEVWRTQQANSRRGHV